MPRPRWTSPSTSMRGSRSPSTCRMTRVAGTSPMRRRRIRHLDGRGRPQRRPARHHQGPRPDRRALDPGRERRAQRHRRITTTGRGSRRSLPRVHAASSRTPSTDRRADARAASTGRPLLALSGARTAQFERPGSIAPDRRILNTHASPSALIIVMGPRRADRTTAEGSVREGLVRVSGVRAYRPTAGRAARARPRQWLRSEQHSSPPPSSASSSVSAQRGRQLRAAEPGASSSSAGS